MAAGIVVTGSINADLILSVQRHPRPGETLPATVRATGPGGKGANQACAAALLGADVTMIGAVGKDANAGIALRLLREAGVGLDAVLESDEELTGSAIVSVDEEGENMILVVAGANNLVDGDHVLACRERIEGAAVLVLQGEIPLDGIEAAARLATGRCLLNLAPVVPVSTDTIRRADPLVVNEHEGFLALQLLSPGAKPSVNHTGLVRMLHEAGVPSVVMTLGSTGALVLDAEGLSEAPSAAVKVVDTTGAGDAFVGALAAGLAAGKTLHDAAALAVRVGAYAVQSPGAQSSYASDINRLPQAPDPRRIE